MKRTTRKKPISAGVGPGRPSRDLSAQLHEHLLDVATKEFLKRGFNGTSIDRISAASNVSKMTIYRHYANKAELFRAVAIRATENFRMDLSRIAAETDEPEKVLLDFARASYDDPLKPEMLSLTRMAIAEAEQFPDITYSIYQHRREMLKPLIAYLEKLNEQGVIAVPNTELAAFQFIALASGGVRVLMVTRDTILKHRDHWVKSAVRVFLDGYRNREATKPKARRKKAR